MCAGGPGGVRGRPGEVPEGSRGVPDGSRRGSRGDPGGILWHLGGSLGGPERSQSVLWHLGGGPGGIRKRSGKAFDVGEVLAASPEMADTCSTADLGLVWGALLGACGPPGPSADGADSLAATSLENMRGDFLSVDNITHQNDANRAT